MRRRLFSVTCVIFTPLERPYVRRAQFVYVHTVRIHICHPISGKPTTSNKKRYYQRLECRMVAVGSAPNSPGIASLIMLSLSHDVLLSGQPKECRQRCISREPVVTDIFSVNAVRKRSFGTQCQGCRITSPYGLLIHSSRTSMRWR